ncbi:Hypp8683 [Branchiostoma lanceolatum]|uniref:Hypp8683 protein n=1 Tax=Branchiostoma lanceolatum TaxID=7740 RepID=A0A8K0EIM5_BRALA|nr:Hypp8683 [Branchiostoma lanceolatum]
MGNNGFKGLPNDFRRVTKDPVTYNFNENEWLRVYRVRWGAIVTSDLSSVHVAVSSLTKTICFTHDAKTSGFGSLQYNMDIRDSKRRIGYVFDCRQLYSTQIMSQTYRSPLVIMTVMNSVDSDLQDNVIPWCERFWFARETVSVNLSGSKEAMMQLAALAAKNNNNAVTLVSTVFDLVSNGTEDSSFDVDSIQTNRTWAGEGTKNITCILVSGEKVYKSYFFETKLEESLAANKTFVNKTGDVRVRFSSEKSTTSLPAVDVNGTLTPTEMAIRTVATKLRPEAEDNQQQKLLIRAFVAVSVAAFTGAMLVQQLVKKQCTFQRHDDQNTNDDSPSYCEISDSAFDPLARPVPSIGGRAMPAGPTVGARDSRYAPDTQVGQASIQNMYWIIPDEYFHLNNPGYRYRRSSLPTDDNPYWQIPDEYYGYENTARQANWRPSSLPLTLDVTYENLRQDETVERWQWQPSDLDAQDEDDDVTTFYAAGAEVALPTVTRSGTKHRRYEDPARLSKALRFLRETGEVEKKTGVAAYGRPAGQKSLDMVERLAHGTKPEYWKVVSCEGRSVKSKEQKNISYKTADRLHHVSMSTGQLYRESTTDPLHKFGSHEVPSTRETRAVSPGMASGRRRHSV